jgi:hypothetical protein
MTTQACRTCKHMDVPLTASGLRRIRKDGAYRCSVAIPKLPLPDCVTKAYGFSIYKGHVLPEWGENCPLWEALK